MRISIKNRMIMGVSLLMMTFSFTINANAQNCATLPSCDELGYTETSCLGDSLKCPFDQTKLFCGEKCKAGDIYYSDNTCSEDYNSSKTVVGVVGGVVAGKGVIVDIVDIASAFTNTAVTWNQAVVACRDVARGGKTARLPTIDEGKIIAYNSGAINSGLSKIPEATMLTNHWHWSSTKGRTFDPVGCGSTQMTTAADCNVRCAFDF